MLCAYKRILYKERDITKNSPLEFIVCSAIPKSSSQYSLIVLYTHTHNNNNNNARKWQQWFNNVYRDSDGFVVAVYLLWMACCCYLELSASTSLPSSLPILTFHLVFAVVFLFQWVDVCSITISWRVHKFCSSRHGEKLHIKWLKRVYIANAMRHLSSDCLFVYTRVLCSCKHK